ncbi:hypothetical protein Taro_000848 [Colocasia esculenta]|uniref:Polygalacturonase n=1 Tax=Colocasia esculenta TaxID=4460 RepID=A0A843TD17_COLES|nr:hypothetical protein [Colocasia esculenta]
MQVLLLLGVLAAAAVASSVRTGECRVVHANRDGGGFSYRTMTKCRAVTVSVEKFGAVGDGKTPNTKAFAEAVAHLAEVAPCAKGGGQLYVPPGKWLTGSFNLTSCFTLFLHRDAVILGSTDKNEYPLIAPLPSYGRGRDKAGGRYSSLIIGSNLTDVAITGANGTIDGQGAAWWSQFKKLKNTRGHLIELQYSTGILISNITLLNSPSWNVHPVYSSNIIVSGITILAPVKSPNTDGINPDSCSDVRIEDSYVVSGDDCVAIKSGWDEYGIAVGIPSQRIAIRRLTCVSPTSATIALGSEMSGGIRDVRAEDITAVDTESGVRIKTAIGRGNYVKDIYVRGFEMHTMKYAFWMSGNYSSHPDDRWDPKAIPEVSGISYGNIVAHNVSRAGRLEGTPGHPYTGICISNATIEVVKKLKMPWTCSDVEGTTSGVTPPPCPELTGKGEPPSAGACPFPEDVLPIDKVELNLCSVMLLLVLLAAAGSARRGECRAVSQAGDGGGFSYRTITECRAVTVSVEKFGAVGDGKTPNTKAFAAAVAHLAEVAPCAKGGGQLYVPPGKWLTGSFNLTSCFTLYLHRDAVILGSADINDYPLIAPLPSYGRGRDAAGGRYSSLILGSNLTDVAITGDNGTIDGQGAWWWEQFRAKELNFTRGYLIELLYSKQILVSNVTLVNSPSWNVHPVYSSNIIVAGITILAPVNSPNTDGINPDSCADVRIEDSYVVSGDDCVAIKSGWDEYGIAVGIPSERIAVRRLTCVSPTSATIALGSEMSGGIRDVRAEDITAVGTESGVRIKTAIGRGNYVKDIYVRGFEMFTMKYAFWMSGNYSNHPDEHWDPKAIPEVTAISYSNVVARNVTIAGRMEGTPGHPYTGICISNATIEVAPSKKPAWTCTDVKGTTSAVTPPPCPELTEGESVPADGGGCPFPSDVLPIDSVQFHQCSATLEF